MECVPGVCPQDFSPTGLDWKTKNKLFKHTNFSLESLTPELQTADRKNVCTVFSCRNEIKYLIKVIS